MNWISDPAKAQVGDMWYDINTDAVYTRTIQGTLRVDATIGMKYNDESKSIAVDVMPIHRNPCAQCDDPVFTSEPDYLCINCRQLLAG